MNAFADEGIDVIAEQVDSPITIAQTAEKRGVYVIGKDVNVMDRAPDTVLTGVSWNWGPMMKEQVEAIHAGTWKPSHVRSDLAGGAAVLDDFGSKVPEDVQEKVLARKGEIVDGDFDIWTGPIVAQNGTTVVAEGETMDMEAVETMDFLVEGVVGSAD